MFYPNIECAALCFWMLNISRQRLTAAQTVVTQAIYTAALNNTGVSEKTWNNFNLFAQWRNPYYIVYRDYQANYTTDLLTGLVSYYDFEGDVDDSLGTNNGTNSGLTFSNSFGKIGQGATNSSSTNYATIGGLSTWSFIKNTAVFTINYWFNGIAINSNCRPINNSNSFGANGIYTLHIINSYVNHTISNASGNAYGLFAFTSSFPESVPAWRMYTICGDGQFFYIYRDASLIQKTPVGILGTGNDVNILRLFGLPSGSGSNQFYMDELGIWSRCLNPLEIFDLYNGGAGKTYPFT